MRSLVTIKMKIQIVAIITAVFLSGASGFGPLQTATSRQEGRPGAPLNYKDQVDSVDLATRSNVQRNTMWHSEAAPPTEVQVIEPGIVLIRNLVSDDKCQQLAAEAFKLGEEGDRGFYTTLPDGHKILNTGEDRGRIYDSRSRFSPSVTDSCIQAVSLACNADSEMPFMECTHVLLNMYTSREGIAWHRDIYENDGTGDCPIVNLCVGASCQFGYRHDNHANVVTLRSGDCLLFGGPCRLIDHSVLEVMLDDCPAWMAHNPVRYSFTFRDAPEAIGREEEFRHFKIEEDLVGQDDFTAPEDPKLRIGLPSGSEGNLSRH